MKKNKQTNKLTTDIYEGTFVTPRNVDVHIINNPNIIKENVMVTNSLEYAPRIFESYSKSSLRSPMENRCTDATL